MAKYSYRPAGMSDSSEDDEYDDDGFTFHSEVSQKPLTKTKPKNHEDDDLHEKKREIEFQVVNACMIGNLQVIDKFINAGNDVNVFLHTGWTMLLYAASALKPQVIQHLLELGADPNIHKDGTTALMTVCRSQIQTTTTDDCLKCISILINAKANPDATNKDRATALMFACEYRQAEVVSELLKHVKNIDAMDCDKRTAVFYAVVGNNVENLKLLIEKGVSTTIIDRRHLTIHNIAEIKGYDSILELLNNKDDGNKDESDCPTARAIRWIDVFPLLKKPAANCVDEGIGSMLIGLGLEQYRLLFQGMELNKFLTLTDEELKELGMDIEYHRKQLIDGLLKFHKRKWSNKSIGVVSKSLPYTLYNGVMSLGNIARQIGAIGGSFKFLKNNLSSLEEKNILLSDGQKNNYIDQLKSTEKTLVQLKKELEQMLKLAKKVEKTSNVYPPAQYISAAAAAADKKSKNWPIFIGITLIIGFYLSKTAFIGKNM